MFRSALVLVETLETVRRFRIIGSESEDSSSESHSSPFDVSSSTTVSCFRFWIVGRFLSVVFLILICCAALWDDLSCSVWVLDSDCCRFCAGVESCGPEERQVWQYHLPFGVFSRPAHCKCVHRVWHFGLLHLTHFIPVSSSLQVIPQTQIQSASLDWNFESRFGLSAEFEAIIESVKGITCMNRQ